MEFFKAAARRSKRGYGDKLHRCNDAGEAARVLSRDLDVGSDSGMTIGSMVKAIYDKVINSAAISGHL